MQGQEPIKHYFTQMNAHSYKHTDTHQHFHDKTIYRRVKICISWKIQKYFSSLSMSWINRMVCYQKTMFMVQISNYIYSCKEWMKRILFAIKMNLYFLNCKSLSKNFIRYCLTYHLSNLMVDSYDRYHIEKCYSPKRKIRT